jgi:MGT family glycosyltransferase
MMSKVIFFNVPAQGHINATLPVTAELVRRGENVVYCLTENYRAKIEATGATFRVYDQIQDDYFESRGLDGSNPLLTARQLIETCQQVLPGLIEMVRAEKPDYILYDSMCPWGWMVAKALKTPTVSSMSLLMFTPMLLIKSGSFLTMMGKMLTNFPNLREFSKVSSEIKRTYGIEMPAFADFLNNTGTITINYTSSIFQPSIESFNKTIKFVGPSIAPRADTSGFPFDQLGTKSLIYVSLGTVINQNQDFYRQSIEAFRNSDYQVVMSVGQRTNIASLGDIPANFIVRNFVPQLDVLQHAALFITHAGLNSVHEGLYYDVPLVLVPQQVEQNYVAGRAEELGAGVKLRNNQITAQRLREVATRVLSDPSFKQNATKIGESLRNAGGYQRAVDEIFAMKSANAIH